MAIFITAKLGDNILGSVCPFVCCQQKAITLSLWSTVMHDSGYILIPVPIPIPGKSQSLIPVPIPAQFDFVDSGSDSDSSRNVTDSGIDSDSGIGIVHHCWSKVKGFSQESTNGQTDTTNSIISLLR